jgi:hypothetical protein
MDHLLTAPCGQNREELGIEELRRRRVEKGEEKMGGKGRRVREKFEDSLS